MQIATSVRAMERLSAKWIHSQSRDTRIALVPTMGALHAGHMSLVRTARSHAGPGGRVVVSIYVNPTQFGPREDLQKYPRDLKQDIRLCRTAKVDAVFAPTDAEMYPQDAAGEALWSTYVTETSLSQRLEGRSRPTHFRGVTTVVAKLLNLVRPSAAVFGAKDWQQAAVVLRMITDLNMPVKIIVAPTCRERDGLALSSRNRYLTPDERPQAVCLSQAIRLAKEIVARAAPNRTKRGIMASSLRRTLSKLISEQPSARIDYIEFFRPDTLQPVRHVAPGIHMALAVFIGKTRLIDNARL